MFAFRLPASGSGGRSVSAYLPCDILHETKVCPLTVQNGLNGRASGIPGVMRGSLPLTLVQFIRRNSQLYLRQPFCSEPKSTEFYRHFHAG